MTKKLGRKGRPPFSYAEMAEISQRIHAKIDAFTKGLDPDADHIWPHEVDRDGYAVLSTKGDGARHQIRVARWLLGETIQRELDVTRDEHALHDNRCGSKRCINLKHLRIGTQAENSADWKATGRPKVDPKTQAGFVIRDLVQNAGVSQSKVARTLGVPYNTVKRALKP